MFRFVFLPARRSQAHLTFVFAVCALAFLPLGAARAATNNILTNPGFELTATNLAGWMTYGPNNYNENGASVAHSGTNYYKVYQDFSGNLNYSGIYQDNISAPGVSFSASGWAYTLSSDQLAGQNAAWIEVTFRDATTTVLALYRSAIITTNLIASGAFPPSQWINLPVTNQYDPNTFQITNTTSTLMAPPGTSFVRYQIVLQGDANYSNGSLYFDDLVLDRAPGPAMGNWNVVWSDEFNGFAINPNTWTFDIGNNSGWGNNELEYYTGSLQNAFISDGMLNIVALQQPTNGFNFTSARIKSEGLFSAKYGRFEWRARLPAGVGLWPALWLLGTNINSVGWPGCGEIDVVENNGANPTFVQGSLHTGGDATQIYTLPGGSTTNFHDYILEWTTNALNWFVDGVLYENQTNWTSSQGPYPTPFNQPFFIIMNLAVGGNYPGNPAASSITALPATMQIDYVRIYNQTQPLLLSTGRNGGSLVLSWPTNIVCHLQTQTNSGAGPGTNWLDLKVTQSPYITTPGASGAFYRLASP